VEPRKLGVTAANLSPARVAQGARLEPQGSRTRLKRARSCADEGLCSLSGVRRAAQTLIWIDAARRSDLRAAAEDDSKLKASRKPLTETTRVGPLHSRGVTCSTQAAFFEKCSTARINGDDAPFGID
jgi:hypothetical protein